MRLEINLEAELGVKPNSLWKYVEYKSLSVNMLLIMLRLGYTSLVTPAKLQSDATEVVSLCQERSKSASDNQLWLNVADIFEQVFLTRAKSANLVEMAISFSENKLTYLQMMCLIGVLLAKDTLPEKAFEVSLLVVPYFDKKHKNTTIYREIIWPFLYEYWLFTVTTKKFRFRTPNLVIEGIQKLGARASQKILSLLTTVGMGLNFPSTLIEEEWLKNQPDKGFSD
jgi:hypothetical protein